MTDKIEEMLKKIQLSKNFNALEFANSKDGYAIEVPKIELFEKLQKLRDAVGSITITSGFRTKSFNDKIGGSKNSNHTKELAADLVFNFAQYSAEDVIKMAHKAGFNNLGLYYKKDQLQWIHVDIGTPWKEGCGWVKYKEMSVKIYNL